MRRRVKFAQPQKQKEINKNKISKKHSFNFQQGVR